MINKLAIVGTFVLAVVVSGCAGNNLGYSADDLAAFRGTPGAVVLDFATRKGNQAAFYVGPKTAPDKLVVIFPGIGSRALDFLEMVKSSRAKSVGYLMLDYPGRGLSEGTMRPKHLPWTMDGAMGALCTHLKTDEAAMHKRTSLIGHSFGSGVALMWANRNTPQNIVLLAPFTTMKKALFRRIGPLAWLIPDNIDNRRLLRQICRQHASPQITIIHGEDDKSIPIAMGKQLGSIDPTKIKLVTISEGTHVSILETERERIWAAALGE